MKRHLKIKHHQFQGLLSSGKLTVISTCSENGSITILYPHYSAHGWCWVSPIVTYAHCLRTNRTRPFYALSMPSLCPLYGLCMSFLFPLYAFSTPSPCPMSFIPSLRPLHALCPLFPLYALPMPSLRPLHASYNLFDYFLNMMLAVKACWTSKTRNALKTYSNIPKETLHTSQVRGSVPNIGTFGTYWYVLVRISFCLKFIMGIRWKL